MLKQKSKLGLACLLGGFLLTTVVFTSCNNDADSKKTETTVDSSATKMESTTPAPDSNTAPKMDTAATRPLKPGT